MSRLPRLHSSPMSSSVKRKNDDLDFEATDEPRKLPAIGSSTSRRPNDPLKPSRTATNLPKPGPGPPPLTRPRAPTLSTSSTSRARDRATSAPPKTTSVSSRKPTTAGTASRVPAGRIVSNPVRGANSTEDKITSLQSQLTSYESARAADAASLNAALAADRAKFAELQASHLVLSQKLATAKTQELEGRRVFDERRDEWDGERRLLKREVEELEGQIRKLGREGREKGEDLKFCREELERERGVVSQLKSTISHQSTAHLTLGTQNEVLQAQSSAVQASYDAAVKDNVRLKMELEDARKRIQELEAETREAEGIRRKLHNMVQELKGNIRVFCRVRPVLDGDVMRSGMVEETDTLRMEVAANWLFPDKRDHKEISVSSSSESATGQERKELYSFGFDRVFEPQSTQAEVFEEVSQLAQSCIDGYHVCIFAYGQTGSGKSWTMEGGGTAESSGMIPRAVEQVFRVTDELKSKGWSYKMEGQFVEIYNETINDLLGKHEFDKKKHEIKHITSASGSPTTRVTDINTIPLTSASQVRTLLSIASSRRTVASTLMNERSSRSHSVFTLRIEGRNSLNGEICEGSLNLVDLAGSERLKEVGHGNGNGGGDKERLKETQSINRSLSALGDVIAALGEAGRGAGEKHIPYRNSKLTYLLQNSLSGNSKTLMVLNLSPMAAHLNESLTSLRFATKVNNTTIGTAKKQVRTT